MKPLILLVTCYLLLAIPIHAQTNNTDTRTTEEWAVQDQIYGLPQPATQSSSPQTDQNLITKLVGLIQNWVSGLQLFIQTPIHKEELFGNSGSAQGAYLPPELKPNPNSSPTDQLKQDLGGSSGVYGANLPQFGDGIGESEKNYEQANFPPGIHPITGSQ